MLHQSNALAQRIRKLRFKNGSLALDFPETKIRLDEQGRVLRLERMENDISHQLIEEFMLLANEAVAAHLISRNVKAIHRIHEEPDERRLQEYREEVLSHHVPCGNLSKPTEVQKLLHRLDTLPIGTALKIGFLKSLMRARYAIEPLGHYGLAKKHYTHFTSPIRRYADLIVHRALISALGLGGDGLSETDIARLHETAEIISSAERRAMAAERDTVDRLVAAHLKTSTGAHFTGRIAGVVGAGLFVRLDETGADGFVPASTLPGRFVHDEVRHALVGALSGETFQLGDRVEVRLVEVTPIAGGLRFEMVSEGREGAAPVHRRFRGRKPRYSGKRR
jgi:ribonuclease R